MKAPDPIVYYVIVTVLTIYALYYILLILSHIGWVTALALLKRHLARTKGTYHFEILERQGKYKGKVACTVFGTYRRFPLLKSYSNRYLTEADLDEFHRDVKQRIISKAASKATITHPYTPKEDNNV